MPKRLWLANHYHIYNRGYQRSVIFRDDQDRRQFLSKLDLFCQRDDVELLAYCLMDNHYHLAVWQRTERPLSRTMHSLLMGYTRYFNRKYGLSGSLFQSRFQAKPIFDDYAMARLTRYIHLNPHPYFDFRTYRWSSYRQYSSSKQGIAQPGPVIDSFFGSNASYAIFCEKIVSPGEGS
jgi:putative transposase